jgi:hypothetical protein
MPGEAAELSRTVSLIVVIEGKDNARGRLYQTLAHNLTKHYIRSVSAGSLGYKFVVIRGGEGGDPRGSPHLQRLGVVGASLRAGSASSC